MTVRTDLRPIFKQIEKALLKLTKNQIEGYKNGELWIVLELHKERWDNIMRIHARRGEELKEKLIRLLTCIDNKMLKQISKLDTDLHIDIDSEFRLAIWVEPRENAGWGNGHPSSSENTQVTPTEKAISRLDRDWQPLIILKPPSEVS